jgi:hypothetical protein
MAMGPGTARPAAWFLACLAFPSLAFPLAAQVPFGGDRSYNQCSSDAYRRAGPPPRGDPRPGDDLAVLARRQRDYEDRYYRALDQCLRDMENRRVRRN